MIEVIIDSQTYQYPENEDENWGDIATNTFVALVNWAQSNATALDTKINISDIVDNVTSTDTDKPLSANQGKELQDQLDAMVGNIEIEEVTAATKDIEAGKAYIANRSSQITFTLPATMALGERFMIIGKGSGGWKIAQNAGQQIKCSLNSSNTDRSTKLGATGRLQSLNTGDCVDIVCITADTLFRCINKQGICSFSANWYGDGSDDNLIVSSDITIDNDTTDPDVWVSNYNNLTIDVGYTLDLAQRCKGWVIYALGDVNINGTLMAPKAPEDLDPVTENVHSDGIIFIRLKDGGSDTRAASLVDGLGTAIATAEANQSAIAGDGTEYQITREGGAGGSGAAQPSAAGTGSSDADCAGGGGAGGGAPAGRSGGDGEDGNCFGGGAGGGGAGGYGDATGDGQDAGTDGEKYGGEGTGGEGGGGGTGGGGGGAGAEGGAGGAGAGTPAGDNGVAGAADACAGMIYIICQGDVNIGASGKIDLSPAGAGGKGGDGSSWGGGGGGGAGGGHALILHGGSFTNDGSIDVSGGTAGAKGNGSTDGVAGGTGGAGSYQEDSIDV